MEWELDLNGETTETSSQTDPEDDVSLPEIEYDFFSSFEEEVVFGTTDSGESVGADA